MLKGIPKAISQELLKTLAELDHGDEIVAADENFKPANIERRAFYERAKKAYAVIATGETAIYANIILKKGVVK